MRSDELDPARPGTTPDGPKGRRRAGWLTLGLLAAGIAGLGLLFAGQNAEVERSLEFVILGDDGGAPIAVAEVRLIDFSPDLGPGPLAVGRTDERGRVRLEAELLASRPFPRPGPATVYYDRYYVTASAPGYRSCRASLGDVEVIPIASDDPAGGLVRVPCDPPLELADPPAVPITLRLERIEPPASPAAPMLMPPPPGGRDAP